MKIGGKSSLSVRDRALFNAKLDLERINLSRMHIGEVYMPSKSIKFLYLRDSFYDKLKEYLGQMPFHSDEYETIYNLVNDRIYKDMLVVTELEIGNNSGFEKLCEVQMVFIVQHTKRGLQLFGSKGRDFFQINIGDQYEKTASCYHECTMYLALYKLLSTYDYNACSGNVRRVSYTVSAGEMWTCPACGYSYTHVMTDSAVLLEKHKVKF